MEEELLKAARELARTTQRTLSAVIEDAVREAVSQAEIKPASAWRLPVSRESGGLRPGVNLDDNRAVRDLMDGFEDPSRD